MGNFKKCENVQNITQHMRLYDKISKVEYSLQYSIDETNFCINSISYVDINMLCLQKIFIAVLK